MNPIVHPLKSRDDLPVHDATHRWSIITLTTKTPTVYCIEKGIPECWGPLERKIYILRDATPAEIIAAALKAKEKGVVFA